MSVKNVVEWTCDICGDVKYHKLRPKGGITVGGADWTDKYICPACSKRIVDVYNKGEHVMVEKPNGDNDDVSGGHRTESVGSNESADRR